MYFVYLIRNKSTKHLYIGYTKDLKRRLIEHQNKNPEIIYYEAYKNKQDAVLREIRLKQKGQSLRWLKERVEHSLKK